MKKTERIRELRDDFPSPDEARYKTDQGWRLTAIEWQREVELDPDAPRPFRQEPPFGLRIEERADYLVEDEQESETLRAMLGLVIDDELSFSQAARVLNERGYRTRSGAPWTQVAVFEMMPRIVDAAPRIFGTEAWAEERGRDKRAIA